MIVPGMLCWNHWMSINGFSEPIMQARVGFVMGITSGIYGIFSATLFWVAVLTAITGLLLLLVPGWLLRLSERLNVWIDTSSWFRKLDEPHQLERLFYRHHVVMGALILAGSLYSLWFIWRLQGGELLVLFPAAANRVLLEILQSVLIHVLLLGNLLALVIGLVVIVRPSLLKGLESRANRWVSSDRALSSLDKRVDVADRIIPGYPRLLGLLILLGSLYIMSNTLFAVLPG